MSNENSIEPAVCRYARIDADEKRDWVRGASPDEMVPIIISLTKEDVEFLEAILFARDIEPPCKDDILPSKAYPQVHTSEEPITHHCVSSQRDTRPAVGTSDQVRYSKVRIPDVLNYYS